MADIVYPDKFYTPQVAIRLAQAHFEMSLAEQTKLTWLRLLQQKMGELSYELTLLTNQLVDAEVHPEFHKRIASYALMIDSLHQNIGTYVTSQTPVQTPFDYALNEIANYDEPA